MRASGILLPIFSLPSPYGIGTLGKTAYQFIDFLHLANQKYWQVLPLGPTSYGDSPYQTFSSFAGNPYFIDLDILKENGYLKEEEVNSYRNLPLSIDYGYLYQWRFQVLKKAFYRFQSNEAYLQFIQDNISWIRDYALFMSLKDTFSGISWQEWPEEYKVYQEENLNKYAATHAEAIQFWYFVQYQFFNQWKHLKSYAHQKGIELIGDVPIYVALDSVDVWANAKQFMLDAQLKPICVAGCPPDAFAKTGQLWGNPLYNYTVMKQDGYAWWIKRIQAAYQLFDVIRIDHFRGFEAFYAIPGEDSTAEHGKWVKGPGLAFFKALRQVIPEARIIAEDLGFLTEAVHKLLEKTGYPGMKVLEFAFQPDEDSLYLPHHHIKHAVVYTGTHDNLPVRGWFETLNEQEKHMVREYLTLSSDDKVCDAMVREALKSVCDLAIVPIQDYLGLDATARINTPSTKEKNWTWRIDDQYLSKDLANYIGFLTTLYRRKLKE
ncbi:MAG: 4-alpha-glucanotransferase [Prevotella sp.]|nr:4-alpha-glucanotransferase [Staphylococcus sp.]MCM1350292.1 4-alpha-glucanotransferase [Prevotella sp.]